MNVGRQPALQGQLQGMRHHDPVGTRSQHSRDFKTNAKTHSTDCAHVGAVSVVVKNKMAGTYEPHFHRENVPVATTTHIKKMTDLPSFCGLSIGRTIKCRSRASVQNLMVRDQHHFLRASQLIDADAVECFFDAWQNIVMHHHHVRVGEHNVPWRDAAQAAGFGNDFLWACHWPNCMAGFYLGVHERLP